MRRHEKTKSLKHRTVIVAFKQYSETSLCPATVGSNQKPPPTKPRRQATRQKSLKDFLNQMRLRNIESSPSCRRTSKDRRMDSKHLVPQSTIRRFMELKRMFDPKMWQTLLPSGNQLPALVARLCINPRWAESPSLFFNQEVRKYTAELAHAWGLGGSPRIPPSWSVFENVDWHQDGSFRWKLTDSADKRVDAVPPVSLGYSNSSPSSFEWKDQRFPLSSVNSPSDSSLAPSDGEKMSTEYWELGNSRGVLHRGEFAQPRARGQWSFLASMSLYSQGWKPQVEDCSAHSHNQALSGNMDSNQYARNQDIWPQTSFPALLYHWTASEGRNSLSTAGEVPLSQMLGRLLSGVVETEMFPAYFEKAIPWPSSMQTVHSPPIVTYSCRAMPQYLGWHEDMCPLLFAAHYSPYEPWEQPGLTMAVRNLEQAFRPTMALFILYYLDTRAGSSDPLPPWMVLFGLVYTQSGVHVRGHCPSLRPESQNVQNGAEMSGWTTTSWDVYTSHKEVLLSSPTSRGPFLFMLNHIQEHCRLVLERLKDWEGYGRACQVLRI